MVRIIKEIYGKQWCILSKKFIQKLEFFPIGDFWLIWQLSNCKIVIFVVIFFCEDAKQNYEKQSFEMKLVKSQNRYIIKTDIITPTDLKN